MAAVIKQTAIIFWLQVCQPEWQTVFKKSRSLEQVARASRSTQNLFGDISACCFTYRQKKKSNKPKMEKEPVSLRRATVGEQK